MSLTRRPVVRPLSLQQLEARENPVRILFDFAYDTGFFGNAAARSELQRAADDLSSRLSNSLAAINPGGGNSWTARTFNPSNTSQTIDIGNLTVAADTLVVYAGGSSLGGSEAGLGGYGGYSAQGSQAWFDTLSGRGNAFAPWGGAISFDTGTNWNFDASGPVAGKVDFYTVAQHELGHVFGFGSAPAFFANVLTNGGAPTFTGSHAVAANGGTAPALSSDQDHFAQNATSNGQPTAMRPVVVTGSRVSFSALDYAALADIGWTVTTQASTAPVTSPIIGTVTPVVPVSPPASPPVSPPPAATSPPTAPQTGTPVAVSGTNDGRVQLYNLSNGSLTLSGTQFNTAADFTGEVRTAFADVTGDGVKDLIAAGGPGKSSRVIVYDGRTGQRVTDFQPFPAAFTGGAFVAAGDFDGDGKKDVIVSADRNGGPAVRIYSLQGSNPVLIASFYGVPNPDFRGGARIAAGDINGDGRDDLVVAAGAGGGPWVGLYDGRSVLSQNRQMLTSPFYSFPANQTNGTYIAVGDFDGDGYADVAFGAGEGGGPAVRVASGRSLLQQGPNAALTSLGSFYAGDTSSNGGARVSVADVNGDGVADLVASAGAGANSGVWAYSGQSLRGGVPTTLAGGSLFGGAKLSGGVYVG